MKSQKIRLGSQCGEHLATSLQAMAGSWLSIRSLNRPLASFIIENRLHHGVAGTDLKPADSPRFQNTRWPMIHW